MSLQIISTVVATVLLTPLTLLWKACSSPALGTLRAVGLQPRPSFPPYEADMSRRVVIVTGANTGIGARTAFHLAHMGATVIMACRSVERGECARVKLEQEIRDSSSTREGRTGAGTLEVMHLDVSDLESVRAFARVFEEKHGGQLDVLVNNAGIGSVMGGKSLTADGLDMIFGTNFIGHFALTTELLPLIQSTPASRVICLSSVTHHRGYTEWESASGSHVEFPFRSTYADSKLAMVLFAKELRRRFAAAGSSATAFSVNPGAVRSDIWRFIPKWIAPITDSMMRILFLNVDEGCCTSVCASALPLESLSDSDYYQPYWMPFGCPVPCEIMGPFVGCAPGRPTLPKDEPAASAELWAVCERIVATATAARGDGSGAARG